MSYKLNFVTPIRSYDVYFKKNINDYKLTINIDTYTGDKEKILKKYKAFLTKIGLKDKYFDILTHLEIISDFKLESPRVYTYKEDE